MKMSAWLEIQIFSYPKLLAMQRYINLPVKRGSLSSNLGFKTHNAQNVRIKSYFYSRKKSLLGERTLAKS